MATVPTPRTWAAAEKITAALMNGPTGLRDPLNFLLDPPRCDVSDGSGVACANATATLLTYDTEHVDTDSMHSTVSNTSRIVINTPGRFELNIYVTFSVTSITKLQVNLRKNSGGSASGGTSIRTFNFDAGSSSVPAQAPPITMSLLPSIAGDYYEVFVNQTSGASRTTTSGFGVFCTGLQARWAGIS